MPFDTAGSDDRLTIHVGDAITVLRTMDSESVNCIVTSPPYFKLRDYGHDAQIGREDAAEQFVDALAKVFREARRVLHRDGSLWLNLGDSYAGRGGYVGDHCPSNASSLSSRNGGQRAAEQSNKTGFGCKSRDLMMLPFHVAQALRDDGWHLRSDIIWQKPNPFPEAVRNRPTGSYEHLFLFTKRATGYFYDANAIREPGRNARNVWTIPVSSGAVKHFATMPMALAERCIMAGCPVSGVVLDPFAGAGTTGLAALKHGRKAVLVELSAEYAEIARERCRSSA